MADVRIKVLSSGRIPGYPCNGPILNPITVDETVAMRYVNAGLEVHIWSDQAQAFVRCQARDMLDTYNDKVIVDSSEDLTHDCDTTHPEEVSHLINVTRVKTTPSDSGVTYSRSQGQQIGSSEPTSYIRGMYYYEEPDFGDAYEPVPFRVTAEEPPEGLIDIDEFEDK